MSTWFQCYIQDNFSVLVQFVNFQYFLKCILVSLNIVFIFYETPISVLEFELRKAQETIKSLRQSLTRSAGILSYLFMFSLSRFTNISSILI